LQSAIERWDLSPLFISEQPFDFHSQYLREGLEFVVENITVIAFDLGNRGSIELDPESSEPPRKGILR